MPFDPDGDAGHVNAAVLFDSVDQYLSWVDGGDGLHVNIISVIPNGVSDGGLLVTYSRPLLKGPPRPVKAF